MATIKPMGDRVVVKAVPREEITKSGLVIPDTAKEKPQMGEVMAVGPGRLTDEGKRLPMDVKVGDKVLFARYAGTDVPKQVVGGEEEWIVLKESDILAIMG
ncbi:MAG: co-chaperone GroES [Chloroflexi bacterium]|nr:co-chaperone GroES [Chloroflexota bacterium]